MERKLTLDALRVDTFETGAAEIPDRGTVAGHMPPACTERNTCKCPTSIYACSTRPATSYSCEFP